MEKAVAVGGPARAGRERASLGGVDVEPAVAVVVEQAQARAHRLGNLSLLTGAGIVAEAEADGLGVVGEGRGGSGRGGGRPCAGRVGGGAEVGEDLGAGRGDSAGGLGPRQPLEGRLLPRPRHEAAARREFPPGTGLEQAAQRLGMAGELLGRGRRVGLEEALPVPLDDPVQLGLAAPQAGGLGLVAGQLGQPGEAVERAKATGGDRDEPLQRPALGPEVPGAGGEPGADRPELLWRQGVVGKARQGAAGPGDVLRGQGQVEPGTPDGRVVRPARLAFLQEFSGFTVVTHPGREVGPGEPDAVVVRRVLRGVLDDVPEFLQEDGARVRRASRAAGGCRCDRGRSPSRRGRGGGPPPGGSGPCRGSAGPRAPPYRSATRRRGPP